MGVYVIAVFAAALIGLSGCENAAVQSSSPMDAIFQQDLMSYEDFYEKKRESEDRGVQKFQEMLAALRSVRDTDSARNAIDQIRSLGPVVQPDFNNRFVEISRTQEKEVARRMNQIKKEGYERGKALGFEISQEADRISSTRGISPAALAGLQVVLKQAMATLESSANMEIPRVYPGSASATFELVGNAPASELFKYVKGMTGATSIRGVSSGGQFFVRAGPVRDVDQFVDRLRRLQVGKLTGLNGRSFVWTITNDDLARLRADEEKEKLAKLKRQEAEEERKANQKLVQTSNDVDMQLDDLARQLKRIETVTDWDRYSFFVGSAAVNMKTFTGGVKVQLDQDLPGGSIRSREAFQRVTDEFNRLVRSRGLRVAMKKDLADATLEALFAYGPGRGDFGDGFDRDSIRDRPARKPNDPDTVLENVALLESGDWSEKEDAAKSFLQVNPSKMDREVRVRVARALRGYALSRVGDAADKAEVLAHWAGKQSVPIIIRMMEEESIKKADLFSILEKYPTEKSAAAVARCTREFFTRREALDCLANMGPVAENAVIKLVPSNDADICLRAITILAEIGTEKSRDILRQAMRSRGNVNVRNAARASWQQISTRIKDD